jgi:hypothetical protein
MAFMAGKVKNKITHAHFIMKASALIYDPPDFKFIRLFYILVHSLSSIIIVSSLLILLLEVESADLVIILCYQVLVNVDTSSYIKSILAHVHHIVLRAVLKCVSYQDLIIPIHRLSMKYNLLRVRILL